MREQLTWLAAHLATRLRLSIPPRRVFEEINMAAFDRWLGAHMERQRIWSINRLAREAGLNAEHVADWMLGRGLPSAAEAARLAEYLGLSFREVTEAAGLRGGSEQRARPA